MSLRSSYLMSGGRLPALLDAIRGAKAPSRFTQQFLVGLGFPSSSDRLSIGVLKSLRFLDDSGAPTRRYFEYLDASRSRAVMADAIREAYADLFQVNIRAQEMSPADVRNKMQTLTQGQMSDSVVEKMAMTFKALVGLADFDAPITPIEEVAPAAVAELAPLGPAVATPLPVRSPLFGGLVYSININLPESRDPAVYDALFRSLREHLAQ